MPNPTDNGTTYTFKIRSNVKFHGGSALIAADVAASWNKIVFPPEGVISTHQRNYSMVDRIEAPDASTVVFHLKFPSTAFLPALADPTSWIYQKAILDKDMHWYEKNIMGSGPFKSVSYEAGQSIKGVRNRDHYVPGLPYLDGFTGIYADKEAVRVDALRADRNPSAIIVHLAHAVGEVADPGLVPGDAGEGRSSSPSPGASLRPLPLLGEVYGRRDAATVSTFVAGCEDFRGK